MALLAQGFDPSGYTPSYAVANAANEQLFQNQQQGLQNISKGIEDYAKQQKDLAQKDKEMAAKIKGTMSLLDNAKALYPDFAERIDSTKLQLSDPSLSNLDKIGIAGNVENSLNMFAQHGTEGVKTRLMEAQIKQSQAQANIAGRTETEGVVNGKVVKGYTDLQNGQFIPFAIGSSANNSSLSNSLPESMKSLASDFDKYGNQYGVSPALLASISIHETGGGTSNAFSNKNNAMGISNNKGPIDMSSRSASIEKMAKLLGQGINENKGPYAGVKNIDDISKIYAPVGASNDPRGQNSSWASSVNNIYSNLSSVTPQQTQAISSAAQMPPSQQGQSAAQQISADNTVGVAPKAAQVLTSAQEKLQQLEINAKEVQIAESQAKKAEMENNVKLKNQAEKDKNDATVKAIKNTYNQILEAKNHPEIRQAFGIPVGLVSTGLSGGIIASRSIPGTKAADARAKINGIIANSWVKSVIDAKAQGATFGALSDSEGAKLAQAATLLSSSDMITYDTANNEMQNMLEGLKESYKRLTGSDLNASTKSKSLPAKVDPTQNAAEYMMGIPSTLPPQ
tara:strand:- start:1336 stop:3036 length:1701 start_codon:yes stop_codon:yes gene_type:complete